MSVVNLGTWRIVILAALVAFGAVILSNGFSGGPATATPPTGPSGPTGPTGEPTGTQTPEPPPPEGEVAGVAVAVFNGTDAIGLAADVTLKLEDAGYDIGQDATDAPTQGVRRTTVYFRGGADAAQNQANAQLLADEQLGGAKVRKIADDLVAEVSPDTDLVIVLGQDQVPA
jgi:hypothetical protein